MREHRHHQHLSPGRGMLLGGAIAALGVFFLLDKLDLLNFGFDLWDVWPVFLIFWGFIKLGDRYERRGGFWLIGAGTYLLVAQLRLWGLHYGDAWPIILIVGGIGMLFDSVFATDETTNPESRP